jgi:hypothetical protein
MMVNLSGRSDWLGRQDSNLRIAGSKPAALPLGYAPIKISKGRKFDLLDFIKNKYTCKKALNFLKLELA